MANLKQKLHKLFKTDVGKKTLDNVLTIEWAGQKTHLVSPRQSDEYTGKGGYVQVSEEDDREERTALTNTGTVNRRTRRLS